MHVVCGWIGNSPRVAAKHYLQVTEDHYGKAVQNPVQTAHDGGRQEPSGETARSSGETLVTSWQKDATPCKCKGLQSIPPRGVEPLSPG